MRHSERSRRVRSNIGSTCERREEAQSMRCRMIRIRLEHRRGFDLQSKYRPGLLMDLETFCKRNLKVERRKACGAKVSIWKFAETTLMILGGRQKSRAVRHIIDFGSLCIRCPKVPKPDCSSACRRKLRKTRPERCAESFLRSGSRARLCGIAGIVRDFPREDGGFRRNEDCMVEGAVPC